MIKFRRIKNKHFYMLAIILCFAECLSYSLFQTINNSLFYITAFLILLDFFAIRYIDIDELPLLLIVVLYFIGDNIYLTGGYVLGIKYAIIFVAAYIFVRIEFDRSFWQIGIITGIIYLGRYMLTSKAYLEEFENQTSMFGNVKNVQVLNINIPCFFVFICLIFSILYCKSYCIKHEFIVTLFCTVISTVFSLRLNCRVTILTSILTFILMELIPLSFWKNKKRTLTIITFLFIFSCIYPWVVVTFFYDHGVTSSELLFTGRERIWSNFYYYMSSNPKSILLGLGTDYRLYVSGGLTMHNSLLEWAFNFGFVGVAIYAFFSLKVLTNAYDNKISDLQILMIVAYIIMLIFALVNTAIQREYLFIFYSMFLGLAKNKALRKVEDK